MKALIGLNFFVYLMYFFAPYSYSYLYSGKVLDALMAFPIYQLFSYPEWFAWGTLAFRCIVFFLLFNFGAKFKYLFLLLVLVDVVVVGVLSGVQAFVGLDLVLSFLLNALDGVLLLVLFGVVEITSPLFGRKLS